MIYLDNAATTFPKLEIVYSEMDRVNRTLAVNAGRGSYKTAQAANKIIIETKERLLSLFHVHGEAEVVLTPSVTHALNQIILGLQVHEGDFIYVSPYEHNAVARPLHLLSTKKRVNIEMIPLKKDLSIDMDKLKFMFSSKKPAAVFATAISNVTGCVLPWNDLFALTKDSNASAYTALDASQAAGLLDIEYKAGNTDIICFAGHKTLYGPFGIGGFIIGNGVPLDVALAGGTGSNSLNLDMPAASPDKFEMSSTNIVAVAGLNASLSSLNVKEHYDHTVELTRYLRDKLAELDNVTVLGCQSEYENLGIVSFVVEGYDSNEIGTILDEEFDIAVRTGYHCVPFIHEYLGDIPYGGTVRVGVGLFTTTDDIDQLIEALETL